MTLASVLSPPISPSVHPFLDRVFLFFLPTHSSFSLIDERREEDCTDRERSLRPFDFPFLWSERRGGISLFVSSRCDGSIGESRLNEALVQDSEKFGRVKARFGVLSRVRTHVRPPIGFQGNLLTHLPSDCSGRFTYAIDTYTSRSTVRPISLSIPGHRFDN